MVSSVLDKFKKEVSNCVLFHDKYIMSHEYLIMYMFLIEKQKDVKLINYKYIHGDTCMCDSAHHSGCVVYVNSSLWVSIL